jgi:hypothetical protein
MHLLCLMPSLDVALARADGQAEIVPGLWCIRRSALSRAVSFTDPFTETCAGSTGGFTGHRRFSRRTCLTGEDAAAVLVGGAHPAYIPRSPATEQIRSKIPAAQIGPHLSDGPARKGRELRLVLPHPESATSVVSKSVSKLS